MKKILLLCFVCILLIIPFSIAASESSGNLGTISWVLDDTGTLTISGKGKLPDFTSNTDSEWKQYKDQIKKIIIEEGITGIGECSFCYCTNCDSVKLPSTITSIGGGSFGATKIQSINIPAGVSNIGLSAFGMCDCLVSINVDNSNSKYSSYDGVLYSKDKKTLLLCPEGKEGVVSLHTATEILGEAAFCECKKVRSINSSKNIKELKKGVFLYCGIESFDLPSGITEIPGQCFEGCSNLKSITIPQSVKSINSWAFARSGIESITIPSSVKQLDYASFYQCSSLKKIVIPNSVTDIGIATFMEDKSLVQASVPTMYHPGGGYTGLTGDIESSKYIFKGCTSLQVVAINGGKYISEGAFSGCYKLREITIAPSITKIYDDAFEDSLDTSVITIRCVKGSFADTWAQDKGFIIEYFDHQHDMIHHERVEPTYTSTGTEEYWECSSCGKLFSDAEGKNEIAEPIVIPMLEAPTDSSDPSSPGTGSDPGTEQQEQQQPENEFETQGEQITLKKIKISKITALSKKKIKVEWKKLSKKTRKATKQIQIQVSTDKNFENIVADKKVKSSKTSVSISGLKKGTKYYVRIRAFTESEGIRYVSPWSSVKKVKTKKK